MRYYIEYKDNKKKEVIGYIAVANENGFLFDDFTCIWGGAFANTHETDKDSPGIYSFIQVSKGYIKRRCKRINKKKAKEICPYLVLRSEQR